MHVLAVDPRERRELMWRRAGCRHDMTDVDSARNQCIGHELPMALPPLCFSAHDGGDKLSCKGDQGLERCEELLRCHVIGIGAERGVSPAGVRRVRTGRAQPSEPGEVVVSDGVRAEEAGQRLARKVRMTSRPRHGPYVRDCGDAMCTEQRQELIGRSRGMTDGHDPRVIGHAPAALASPA